MHVRSPISALGCTSRLLEWREVRFDFIANISNTNYMGLEGISSNEVKVGRVVARLARLLEGTLAEHDLSLPQYRLLFVLADESSAQAKLAAKLAVSPPSVTAVVDGLVDRGLVARVSDERDRRKVVHVLTAEGRDVLLTADTAAETRLSEITASVDSRTAQRALRGLELWERAFEARRLTKAGARSALPAKSASLPRQ